MYPSEGITASQGRTASTRKPAANRFRARAGSVAALAALTLALLPAATGSAPGSPAGTARADDTTVSSNNMRTDWDQTETAMTPAVVPTFVKRFTTAVNGQVWAQPLVISSLNTVIVATENDEVYGVTATGPNAGQIQWQTSLGTPFDISASTSPKLAKCHDLVPNIGVTGAPVYDPATGDLYLFGQIMVGGAPKWDMFALNAGTGGILWTKQIFGHPSNNRHITLNPAFDLERPGALLFNGAVYGAFGSHCDDKPYAGYVAGVNITSHTSTLWTDESGVTYNQGGIWQAGGGMMAANGKMFITTSNGVSPPRAPGKTPPRQLGESVVQLAVNPNGTLVAKDFFSPTNSPALAATNDDLGAGGPVALPFGTARFPHVMVQAGKDGHIFLLNRDNLGGREQGKGGTNDVLSETAAFGGLFGHPAVFTDGTALTKGDAATTNHFVFYVGKNDFLRVLRVGVNGAGAPVLSDVGNSALRYGYTSGSPVVTTNGLNPASAVVWVVHTADQTGAGADLEAYALGNLAAKGGKPSACTAAKPCKLRTIWHAPIGTAVKFTTPATSNGWIYVGTRDGDLLGFAAPGTTAPVQSAATTFAPTTVSTTIAKDVPVTATRKITFTGVTASTGASNTPVPTNQFSVTKVTETKPGSTTPVPVTFPVTLVKGDKLTAAMNFLAAAPGAADGTLSYTTSSKAAPTVNVPLTGDGTASGLVPEVSTLSMQLPLDTGPADVPVGVTETLPIGITNFGTTPQTVTSVTPPAPPFTAVGLPAVGTTISPGQTVNVEVSFAPTAPGPVTGSFTIAGSSGPSATVTLTGTGTAAVSQLSSSDPVVNFGNIPVGKQATRYVHVANTGNQSSTVAGTSTPAPPFAAPVKPAAGLPFVPQSNLAIPVTFTPTKKGPFTAHYQLTWTDPTGSHTLTVTLTGTGI